MERDTPGFWTESVGNSARVVGARGELDAASAPGLRSHIGAALDAGCHVVVDLRELVYFDSVGLTVLIQAWQLAETRDRKITFVASDPIAQKLHMRGVESFLPIAADYDSALAQITAQGPGRPSA